MDARDCIISYTIRQIFYLLFTFTDLYIYSFPKFDIDILLFFLVLSSVLCSEFIGAINERRKTSFSRSLLDSSMTTFFDRFAAEGSKFSSEPFTGGRGISAGFCRISVRSP